MAANKTIKFFISSTFKDFEQERDVLHKFVFPKLKMLCHKSDFGFQPIDLRWGVMEEAGVDQQTMNICLNEIKRSSNEPKPNLLLLVGQRYGWVPLPYDIEENEFENILTEIQKQTKKSKLNFQNHFYQISTVKEWYIQDPISTINEWYILDENSNPKTYFLQEKSQYKDNRDGWTKIENQIKAAFQNATNIERYHTSATEQEMSEGLDAFSKDVDHNHTFAYFRTIKDYEQVDEKKIADFIDDDLSKLNELSERLQKKTNIPSENQIVLDDVKWDDISKARETKYETLDLEKCPIYLKDFHDEILERFEQSIQTEIDRVHENSITDLQIELEEQKKFLELKSEIVMGRDQETKKITDFIESENTEPQYYLQYGKSGSGKTSVMAKAIKEIDKDKYEVIYRFIGTTALSTYSRILFESIYWEIETKLQNNPNITKPTFEYDEQKFKEEFHEQLKRLEDKQVVIFLDALDQFEDYNDLTILLEGLPQNIKIVFSTLYDKENDTEDYYRYYNRVQYLENKYLLEPLIQTDNRTILEAWLDAKGRTLTDTQYTDIEALTLNKTPLFLKLVFEMVKHFKVDSEVSTLAKSEEGLIVQFFNFIQMQYHHEESLVEYTLGLISASKDGLSEEELLDLFSRDKEFLQQFQNKRYQQLDRLPTAIWSRFYYYIEEFFTEKLIDGEMLIIPFHRIISETIKKEYYETKAEQLHKDLADYFLTLQDTEKVWDERYNNLHMLSETPYQLFKSNNSEGLKEILFDLEFAGSIYDNQKQVGFREIMEKATQLDDISEDKIYPWESFYREKEHLIIKVDEKLWRPHQSLFQLAYEDGDNSHLSQKADKILEDKRIDFIWLKSKKRFKKFFRSGILRVVSGHTNTILTVQEFSDGNIFSCSEDGEARISNPEGKIVKTFKLKLNKLSWKFIPTKCNHMIFSNLRNPIEVWNSDGEIVKYLKGHTGVVLDIEIFDDGRILSYCSDNICQVWSSSFQRLSVSTFPFSKIKLLNNDRLLSLSEDNILKIHDLQGRVLKVMPKQDLTITGIDQFDDGRILSHGDGYGIQVWSSNAELLYAWDLEFIGFTTSPTGNIIIFDMFGMQLFDKNYNLIAEFNRHIQITDAMFLDDGSIISYSRWLKNVKIWNIKGELIRLLDLMQERGVGNYFDIRKLKNSKILIVLGHLFKFWNGKGQSIDILDAYERQNDKDIVGNNIFLNNNKNYDQKIDIEHRKLLLERYQDIKGLVHLPDGRIVTCSNISLRFYDVDGEPTKEVLVHQSYDITKITTYSEEDIHNMNSRISSLQFVDGQLISISYDYIRFWSQDGVLISKIINRTSHIYIISVNQIIGFNDKSVLIYNGTWKEIIQTTGEIKELASINEKFIYISTSDQKLLIYTLDGKLLIKFSFISDMYHIRQFQVDKLICSAVNRNTNAEIVYQYYYGNNGINLDEIVTIED